MPPKIIAKRAVIGDNAVFHAPNIPPDTNVIIAENVEISGDETETIVADFAVIGRNATLIVGEEEVSFPEGSLIS